MLSAISPLGKLRFMLTSETVTSKTFLTFLKRLIRGVDNKIYLITDGHPVHKTKRIKDFLVKNKERIELFIQPPYSPELNPDELVWNEVKSNDIGRKRIGNISELKSAIYNKLFTLQKTPGKVIGFFKKDTTKYILEAAL